MADRTLQEVLEKLAGASASSPAPTEAVEISVATDPVFVEKLAAAVEHMVESLTPAAPAPAQVVQSAEGLAEKLASILKKKLASKQPVEGKSEAGKLASAVLEKLKISSEKKKEAEAAEVFPVDSEADDDAQVTSTVDQESQSIPTGETLADILASALDGSSNKSGKEAPAETVKEAQAKPTARAEAVASLKEKLRASIGKEE